MFHPNTHSSEQIDSSKDVEEIELSYFQLNLYIEKLGYAEIDCLEKKRLRICSQTPGHL